jgi:DNA-binding response OmpR family regulator
MAEDEGRIASFVERGLKAAGYAVTAVDSGKAALELARTGSFDLILLDLGLPDLDGMQVLAGLRTAGIDVPVILLTARDAVRDVVAGLDAGASDYLTKPFRFDELLARIRTRLRDRPLFPETVLEHGGIALDLLTRRLEVGDEIVDLSAREFGLLEEFLRHPGQVLSREQLLSRVWGYDFDPGSNVVDVYVRYLRQKVGRDRIETVRGMGYRFD